MTLIQTTLSCQGITPLLMHNVRMVDPLDPIKKQLDEKTSLVDKSDEIHEEISRLEFMGGIYFAEGVGPYLPSLMLKAAITKAGGMVRLGTKVTRGVLIEQPQMRLEYEGPRDLLELFADKRFVHRAAAKTGGRGGGRVMRTRPVFTEWSVTASIILDTAQLGYDQLIKLTEEAGRYHGVGDWRPEHGRFTVTATDPVEVMAD